MGDQVGNMAVVLSYQQYLCQIIIAVSAFIYSLVLLSITLFRPWTTTRTARILAITTALTFLAGAVSRITALFVISHPELGPYLHASTIILAVLCSCCACIAWMRLDNIFAIRKPEEIADRVFCQIKEKIEDLDDGSGLVSTSDIVKLIDAHVVNVRDWTR